ncbi:uncharacterized protein LOC130751049 isoform X1 [Actinidia eriantha]|uniref:uncharacterized protein LOC130751049 isoform X1 n=1 Tax=Actinidia eriantha TaxID=165200 RepID=UPI0025873C0E|nr:uncharacterized protein LOC130751049 isoform X1 [Actinidia eriantha]
MSVDFSLYDLEFLSTADDAWYSVRVVLEDDALVVKFLNFAESADERFRPGDFESAEAVDEFVRRFRPISQQLQDRECSRVVEGMAVCASFAFLDDDIRFYDAVVESVGLRGKVHYVNHSFAKEEEECLCTFVLFWKHGPNEGNLTSAGIANVCLVQPFPQIDYRVASFSKMVKEKIEIASLIFGSVSDCNASLCTNVMPDKENSHSSTGEKSSLSQHGLQVKDGVRQFGSFVHSEEGQIGKCYEKILQDTDLGGESDMGEIDSHHFILIENLERNLSPASIMEFMHRQTSIAPQAYVFPSLSSESYTRGAIVLDCLKKLKTIRDFLNSPDHIVISSRGRPWVISEIFLRHGRFRTTLESLMPISPCKFQNRSIVDELKVAHRGTKEYRTAKSRRDLFMDFIEHQHRLHKRLALEEKKILQLSAAD